MLPLPANVVVAALPRPRDSTAPAPNSSGPRRRPSIARCAFRRSTASSRSATSASSGSPASTRRRQLWIARVNAAARAEGISYSKFIAGLAKAGVALNRKMLSEIAIHDPEGFKTIVEIAKNA